MWEPEDVVARSFSLPILSLIEPGVAVKVVVLGLLNGTVLIHETSFFFFSVPTMCTHL